MEDEDKTGGIVHGSIHLGEHAQDNTVDGMKEAVEELAVIEKELSQVFIYREDTVSVLDIN